MQRQQARAEKNWQESDRLRNELDARHVFVFDGKGFEDVYYTKVGKTRAELIEEIQREIRAEKHLDAWIYSINSKNK